jgi:hypothetical protein
VAPPPTPPLPHPPPPPPPPAGPTQAPRDAEQTDVADSDGLLQSSQIDRRESATSSAFGGPGPQQSANLGGEPRDYRPKNQGDLGGDGLHQRINDPDRGDWAEGDVNPDDLESDETIDE